MKKGTKVGWSLKNGSNGTGTVISDEENGHVLVAADSDPGGPKEEFHLVIWCAVTWLIPQSPSPA